MRTKLMSLVLVVFAVALLSALTYAQDTPFGNRPLRCTNGTTGGTYGYRMSGVIVGQGPVLVNGIFTNNPDGTGSGRVYLSVAGQTIPDASWSIATFQTNSDCTGKGSFFFAAFNQTITYDFVVTDGGRQIELINTDTGNSFNGYGRRISNAGRAPSCNNGTILGTYGYRLEGSLPGVPNLSGMGIETYALDAGFNGIFSGSDTNSFNGQIVRRTIQGKYKVNTDCTGTGNYTDSLGNAINFVFVAVDGGREIFFQGTDPGISVSGGARRLQ